MTIKYKKGQLLSNSWIIFNDDNRPVEAVVEISFDRDSATIIESFLSSLPLTFQVEPAALALAEILIRYSERSE